MKCRASKLLTLALAFTLALVLVTPAQAKMPLRGAMELYFLGGTYPDPVWGGTISGDINGDMYFYNTGSKDVGQAHFFWEEWEICDSDTGELILFGIDTGVVTWKNDKYRMNGVVTDAGPGWEHLVGRNVHMSGSITFDPDTGAPLTAPGMFRVN